MTVVTWDPAKFGIRVGRMFPIVSVSCLCGTPIAWALIQSNDGSYLRAQLVIGSIMLLSALALSRSRLSLCSLKVLSKC